MDEQLTDAELAKIRASVREGIARAEMRRHGASVEVQHERDRQDAKWGEQNHGPEVWHVVLSEEVGELAEAILTWRNPGDDRNGSHCEDMRTEAIQVAAVAQAFVEYLDRQTGR